METRYLHKIKQTAGIIFLSVCLWACNTQKPSSPENIPTTDSTTITETGQTIDSLSLQNKKNEINEEDPRLKEALKRFFSGETRSAISLYNKIIADDTTNASVYYLRGYAYDKLARNAWQQDTSSNSYINPAITDYNKAIALDPNNPDFYFHRATLKLSDKKKKFNRNEILSDLNKVITLDSLYTDAYYYRGKVLALQNKDLDAIKDLDMALVLYSDNAQAYFLRGDLCLRQGIPYVRSQENNTRIDANYMERAILNYTKAIELGIHNATIYLNRGIARYEMRYANLQTEEMMQDFNTAVSLSYGNSEVYMYRGIANSFIENYPAAMEDFGMALYCDTSNAEAYLLRALVRYGKGDIEGEITDYDNAIRCDKTGKTISSIAKYNKKKAQEDLMVSSSTNDSIFKEPNRKIYSVPFLILSSLSE